jgi:hypothetical protein
VTKAAAANSDIDNLLRVKGTNFTRVRAGTTVDTSDSISTNLDAFLHSPREENGENSGARSPGATVDDDFDIFDLGPLTLESPQTTETWYGGAELLGEDFNDQLEHDDTKASNSSKEEDYVDDARRSTFKREPGTNKKSTTSTESVPREEMEETKLDASEIDTKEVVKTATPTKQGKGRQTTSPSPPQTQSGLFEKKLNFSFSPF